MSNSYEKNFDILNDFVEENDLEDNNSFIYFYCSYHIETENLDEQIDCKVMITFEHPAHGKVLVVGLDAYTYPVEFWAKSQNMDLEYGVLIIKGTHPNPKIGKYKVTLEAYDKVE